MKTLALSIAPKDGFVGIGTLGENVGDGVSKLSSIISMAIGVMTVVAIIWFLFVFITGAISMIGAGGDKQALEGSRKRITTGIIGLIVVLLAVLIVSLIGKILGIADILNLTSLFGNITNLNK